MRRKASLLLCLAALGAGCGGGEAAVRIPEGFTVRTVKEPALSIALPRAWKSISAGEPEQSDPRLQSEGLTGTNPPMKLLAYDSRSSANLNVLQTRVPKSLTMEQFSEREAQKVRAATKVTGLRQSKIELPAGDALRLTFSTKDNLELHLYFVRHGDFIYVLSYLTGLDSAQDNAKIFDQSAHTFQLR